MHRTERSRLHAQLAGGVAHEFRNGIHSARLALEFFQDACGSRALPARAMLENAHDQLAVTETLVRRLLALGKPNPHDVQPGRLFEVLNDALTMIEPTAQHTEITVQSSIETIDCPVVDASTLRAAFVNLLLNAIEAAGRHGNVELSAARDGDVVEIRVSDSGADGGLKVRRVAGQK